MAQYTLVKRAVAAYHLDGPDEGAEPDRHKVTGNITFTPMLRPGEAVTMMEDNRPITLVPLPVEARISDGVIFHRGVEGVMLLAGGEKMNPDKLLWKAEFKHLQSNGKSFSLTPVVFEAVPGGEVDLSLVAPPPGKPVGTIRGRDGDTIEEMVHEGGEIVLTIRHGDGKTSERRVDVRAVAEGVAGEALADAREYAGTVADSMVRFEELGRQTAADRVSASESASSASGSASAAAGSASGAKKSATAAGSSAAAAGAHEGRAGDHADTAGAHASAAGESAKAADASATAAAGSAGDAKREADRATEQATAATASATEASTHADRAEGVVDTVRWDDDKLTVAGKTSPSLRGPKGPKGEPGDGGTKALDAQGKNPPASATGTNSIALGWMSKSEGTNSTAIAINARAYKDHSVAIGSSSQANGYESVALGPYAKTQMPGDVTIGNGAEANGLRKSGAPGIAIGQFAKAPHPGSTAIGGRVEAKKPYETRIGYEGYTDMATPTTVIVGTAETTVPATKPEHVANKGYVDEQDKATLAEARALVETRPKIQLVTTPSAVLEDDVLYVIPE